MDGMGGKGMRLRIAYGETDGQDCALGRLGADTGNRGRRFSLAT
jgi:hypothetical protein